MQLTEIQTIWDKVKASHEDHGNKISWIDLVTKYVICVDHGPFRMICEIDKTNPRSEDQADFEDNFAS